MSNKVVNLPSGAKLEVQMAPFSVGVKLHKVIASELKSVDAAGLDFSDGVPLDTIKSAVFQLLASDAVEAAVFDCFKYSLYDDLKIDRSTFEPEEARGDYLVAAWEVVSFNVGPFFKSLGSVLLSLNGPITGLRK